MSFFDAHNHLNNELFAENWREVAEGAARAGLVGMIVNGGDLDSSRRAVMMAEKVEIAFAATGIHPEDLPLQKDLKQQLPELEALVASSQQVVAVGELGLDYTLEIEGAADKRSQLSLIEPQLDLAVRLDLPVVLHVRDVPGQTECFEDLVGLLKNFAGVRGQFHCWTGTADQMEAALSLGFYVSFSGILTYGSAGHIVEVAKMVPDNRLLVETDGPFLVPEPRRTEMRKEGLRNHQRLCLPEYVTITTEKLAELRQTSLATMADITTKNAQQLFLDSRLKQTSAG